MSVTSLPARVLGVIRAPRSTLSAIADRPRWADVLLATTLVGFFANAALLSTEVGKLALVDQWERTAIAFGGTVDDARYEQFLALSERGVAYAAVNALLSGPVLVFGLSAVLALVLRGVLRARVEFRQLLAVVAHAGVILAVRQLLATPLQYAGETLASPTTLVRFAGALDEGALLARFLGVLDLFVIWWIFVLAIGVAVLSRRPAGRLALGFAGVYVALALLLAAVMALTGGTA